MNKAEYRIVFKDNISRVRLSYNQVLDKFGFSKNEEMAVCIAGVLVEKPFVDTILYFLEKENQNNGSNKNIYSVLKKFSENNDFFGLHEILVQYDMKRDSDDFFCLAENVRIALDENRSPDVYSDHYYAEIYEKGYSLLNSLLSR